MNSRLFILLVFLGSGIAHAQQQEKKLEDRIMRPNMSMQATEQTRAFGNGKMFSTTNASGDKHFLGLQTFSLKSFFTRSYSGSKNFWTSEYKVNQKVSNVDKSPQESEKVFGTKTVPVTSARESEKEGAPTRRYQTNYVKIEGKSQNSLNQDHVKEMSIDQIRDLLNKNK